MALDKLNLEAYAQMLQVFMDSGYRSVKFQDIDETDLDFKVVYRHDVDVSVEGALAMARVEQQCDVVSTYYFLLTSPLYNMLSKEIGDQVLEIAELGHDIALHFNPYYYGSGALEQIEGELDVFGRYYPFANLDWISFHRPGAFAGKLSQIQLPNGIRHTYEPLFFETLGYYSDSRGTWSYGHPVYSEEFKAKQGLQVLTHPIWWYEESELVDQILVHHADLAREELLNQIRAEVFPQENPEFLVR
jgi:hypothetical protein